jgi:hypothetical protein
MTPLHLRGLTRTRAALPATRSDLCQAACFAVEGKLDKCVTFCWAEGLEDRARTRSSKRSPTGRPAASAPPTRLATARGRINVIDFYAACNRAGGQQGG